MNKKSKFENPLFDLIDNKTYMALDNERLFDKVGVRDYQMKRRYKELRATMKRPEAIEAVRQEFCPYMQYETVQRSIQRKKRYREKNNYALLLEEGL